MDYITRLAHWSEAVKSAEQNINLGQSLKAMALAILKVIEIDKATNKLKEIDPKDLAALIHNATEAMMKGVKLEQDSRKERGRLMNNKPLEL